MQNDKLLTAAQNLRDTADFLEKLHEWIASAVDPTQLPTMPEPPSTPTTTGS